MRTHDRPLIRSLVVVGAMTLATVAVSPAKAWSGSSVGQLSTARAAADASAARPSAPRSLKAGTGDRTVSLIWTAPSSTGGASITDYVIQYKRAATTTWTTFHDTVTTARTAKVTGLTNGTAYHFRLAAKNRTGIGSYSAAATQTPATAPSSPRSVHATSANAAVSLAWTAPSSTGGSAITDYLIQYKRAASTTWTTFHDTVTSARTAKVTGLTNGTAYHFRLAAKNRTGTGSYSAAATQTPATVPSAARSLVTTRAASSVVLSWAAPSSNGGAFVIDYTVQVKKSTATTWSTFADAVSTATKATVTGLTNGTAYHFRVAAKNRIGTGTFTSTASQTPVTVPAIPVAPAATSSSLGSARLTWAVPVDGGSPITDYIVQFRLAGASVWSTFADPVTATPGATVTGLVDGTDYQFRVAAKNAAGTGTFSGAVSYRHLNPLPTLTGLATAGGPSSIVITWSPPTNPTLATTVEVQTGPSATGPWTDRGQVASTLLSASVTGLPDGQAVFVRVRLTGPAARSGPWSDPSSVTPHSETRCGQLTADEFWPADRYEPTCIVSTGSHTLVIGAGATVVSRGIRVDGDGALRVPGTATATTLILDGCLGGPCDPGIDINLNGFADVRFTALAVRSVDVRADGGAWVGNTFTGTTWSSSGVSPRLERNSFAGIDRPVTISNPADISGVKDNTATGTPLQRVFSYSGGLRHRSLDPGGHRLGHHPRDQRWRGAGRWHRRSRPRRDRQGQRLEDQGRRRPGHDRHRRRPTAAHLMVRHQRRRRRRHPVRQRRKHRCTSRPAHRRWQCHCHR